MNYFIAYDAAGKIIAKFAFYDYLLRFLKDNVQTGAMTGVTWKKFNVTGHN
jgi:hypothetical protein